MRGSRVVAIGAVALILVVLAVFGARAYARKLTVDAGEERVARLMAAEKRFDTVSVQEYEADQAWGRAEHAYEVADEDARARNVARARLGPADRTSADADAAARDVAAMRAAGAASTAALLRSADPYTALYGAGATIVLRADIGRLANARAARIRASEPRIEHIATQSPMAAYIATIPPEDRTVATLVSRIGHDLEPLADRLQRDKRASQEAFIAAEQRQERIR